ncbi:MAG: sodium:solute symporter [Methanobacteriota archaeon]|jgi:Na+/proline symporter|nr:MAG: sodium:solute symporter [Euryarchaeota archaeon]HIG19345.1 sodium:solute symporter [Candidatus Poseidoniales archaeon]
MATAFHYILLIGTLGFFGYIGYTAANREMDSDTYLSARGTQNWVRIGLSLFASGMGIWILFGPSEVGYYGGFWDVVGYALSASTPFLLLAYVGPMIREQLPDGVTLADYVRMRIGRPMQIYVGLISVAYMFTFLFAEFTAIGKAMDTLVGMDPLIPMIAVAGVTAAYTTYGGLPASLQTDRWQAWVIIWLILALLLILFGADVGSLINDAKAYNPEGGFGSMSYMDSFASGLALVVAITAAEMFSQGNWQRAWASEDNEALKKGSLLAAGIVLPLVFVMGVLGTVVAGQGAVDDPSAAFFYLIGDAGALLIAAFIVLGIALVCSSADTLQNAIVASISRDLSDGKMELKHARIATIALIPIAIYLATTMDALSVFGIFLFADLLATATVLPVLLTLWDKIDSRASLAGAICGLLAVIAYGAFTADISTGIGYLTSPTNEWGLANLHVFLSALFGSGLVTIGLSFILSDKTPPESIVMSENSAE